MGLLFAGEVLRRRQLDGLLFHFGRIVNDLPVADDHDAVPVPALLLVPGVEAAVNVPADVRYGFLHNLLHGPGIQTINLMIVHLVLLSELLRIQPIKRSRLIRIGPN